MKTQTENLFTRIKKTITHHASRITSLAVIALGSVGLTQSALGTVTYIAPQGLYIDGTLSTTVNAASVASPASVVAANTTNYFNLSVTPQSQANTNLWPAFSASQYGLPSRLLGASGFAQCGGANVGVLTINWVTSDDSLHWATNQPIPQIIVANGATFTSETTNLDLGGHPFAAIYSIANTNTATYWTNLDLELAGKTGI